MALTVSNIKKWRNMLAGKSVLHVNQKLGTQMSTTSLLGYYNDMTQKVTMQPELIESADMPLLKTANQCQVVFPVAVFQYGLGCYDLFLSNHDEKYLIKFKQCADWAVENQEVSGAWSNFFYYYPEHPYGAMAQGEAVSLLCRAFKQFGIDSYFQAAKKGVNFMVQSIADGGTIDYSDGNAILLEYTHRKAVLNGWIFAWWGLYDYCLLFNDSQILQIRDKTLATLVKMLPLYNNRYWSIYDFEGRIASPFYHHLHIAQMQAMYKLTGEDIFDKYAKLWEKKENNTLCYCISFIKKAFQKIKEKE